MFYLLCVLEPRENFRLRNRNVWEIIAFSEDPCNNITPHHSVLVKCNPHLDTALGKTVRSAVIYSCFTNKK